MDHLLIHNFFFKKRLLKILKKETFKNKKVFVEFFCKKQINRLNMTNISLVITINIYINNIYIILYFKIRK